MKKYFDWAAAYELNDLANIGVDGVKVKVFGTSMDSPGRAEMVGMQGHMGYTSCCVCKHCFSPGIGRAKQCVFDGYRDFLQTGSVARQTRFNHENIVYQYSAVSTKAAPEFRTNKFVRDAIAFATQRRAPYLGHKSLPLLSKWAGFDWYRLNVPDLMHDSKLVVEMLSK